VNGQILIVESKIASVSFKNWLLKELKRQGTSPNPLTKVEIDLAVGQAEKTGQILRTQLPPDFGTEAFGIGGVHSISLVNRLKKISYGREDLEITLQRSTGLTDAALKSPYAATEITNLAFVLGMMKGLGLERVHSLKVNLTDGLLAFGNF
jgi:exopolyphosphatase/guanosine-5'-triphosphate,3'-diphosphate pyrophosphatase